MPDLKLKIDTDKCVSCGLCVNDCIAIALELDKNKIPRVKRGGEKRCIKCQHCLAICPTGALSILDKNPENSESVWNSVSSNSLLNLIQSRRSCRQFKQENLSKETIEQLKDMLKWVPTGVNFHRLHFSFIEDIEVMNDFKKLTNQKIVKLADNKIATTMFGRLKAFKKAINSGRDLIFREAPHMVVVSIPVNAPCATIDPIIALSYFEMYAQSLGVGTLWCGYVQMCLQLFPELCQQLEIPDGYKAAYVMLFGAPAVKYARTTQPENLEFSTIQTVLDEPIKLMDKLKRYFWNIVR